MINGRLNIYQDLFHFNICFKMTTLQLATIFLNEDAAFKFSYEGNLLFDGGQCKNAPQCKGYYIIGRKNTTHNGLILRCPYCRNTTSIFYNSIFLRSKLPVSTALHIIYAWSVQMNRDLASHECHVSPDTITNFYQSCRQACIHWLKVEGQPRIGGEGLTVQIDESVISKRKYNRGRLLKERWIFGGTCTETGERFCVSVPDRKAETLLPLIEDFIEPMSIIHSDCWKGYDRIDELDGCYVHQTVNHTQNFVDPSTGAHTQGVERMWREVKRPCRRCEGIMADDIEGYIAEYQWRYRCKICMNNAFEEAIHLISGCPYY